MDQKINIVLVCDGNYALPTLVALQSVKNNMAKGSCIAAHVVTPGLGPEAVAAFKALEGPDFSMRIVEAPADDLERLHESDPASTVSANHVALLKFRLPSVLPSLRRVIYLDSDVLVRGDLSAFWQTDLGPASLAAVRDSGTIYWRHNQAKRHPGYFNSGVMLLDLEKMRSAGSEERLFEVKAAGLDEGTARFVDQNVFNEVFAESVKLVSIRWNCQLVNLKRAEGKWRIEDIRAIYGERFSGYDDLIRHAAIWHFSSKDKPWGKLEIPGKQQWQAVAAMISPAILPPKVATGSKMPAWEKSGAAKRPLAARLVRRILLPPLKVWRKCWRRYYSFMLEDELHPIRSRLAELEPVRREALVNAINRDKVSCEIELDRDRPGTAAGPAVRASGREVVVSLTTHPGRIYDAHYAIHSLLCQTVLPDRVVLWLSECEFPRREGDLPGAVLAMRRRGLELRFVRENLKSYKKIIPALEAFPGAVIVTADDDMAYPAFWLEKLLAVHEKKPDAIWAAMARRFEPERAYCDWPSVETSAEPSVSGAIFAVGCGGVLYPPGSLDERTRDMRMAMRLAPTADDVWMWAMASLRGTGIGVCREAFPEPQWTNPSRESGRNGDSRLFDINKTGNDKQIAAVLEAFPQLRNLVARETGHL